MSDEDFDPNNFPEQEEIPSCGGSVECKACGKFHGWCDEVEIQLKGETMLPRSSGGSSSTQQSGGRAKPSNRLTTTDLSDTPREGKILMVKADPNGKFGPQAICKIAVNGEVKFWYLDIKKNPNYTILLDKFGENENEWAGQRIMLFNEQDDFSDNWFIRVTFPEKSKGVKA